MKKKTQSESDLTMAQPLIWETCATATSSLEWPGFDDHRTHKPVVNMIVIDGDEVTLRMSNRRSITGTRDPRSEWRSRMGGTVDDDRVVDSFSLPTYSGSKLILYRGNEDEDQPLTLLAQLIDNGSGRPWIRSQIGKLFKPPNDFQTLLDRKF